MGSRVSLSGRYGCINCESNSGYFAFLVIAIGVLLFGVYAAKQRRRPPSHDETKDEKVLVDEEGWEMKASENPKPVEPKGSSLDEGWETKPDGQK